MQKKFAKFFSAISKHDMRHVTSHLQAFDHGIRTNPTKLDRQITEGSYGCYDVQSQGTEKHVVFRSYSRWQAAMRPLLLCNV